MPDTQVPDMVVARLPLYLRTLRYMEAAGIEVTSSQDLATRLGLSSAQIRKDLSYFGRFGKQGTGYNVGYLFEQIRQILQVDQQWPMAVVGVGDLGRALAHYKGFVSRGFQVACLFDNNPALIGEDVAGLKVMSIEQMKDEVRRQKVKVAMIAVPASAAQTVANQLVEAGVRAILNYAPITLAVPPGVHVQYIDPVAHLQHMTYYLKP